MSTGDGFGDRELPDFYDQPLIGLRVFRMGGHALHGVYKTHQYTPGENLAECIVAPFRMVSPMLRAPNVTPRPPHNVAALSCVCGFHAYYEGPNTYMEMDRIAGLIEGYGLVTVGSRGFRASKARLVAIIKPDPAVDDNNGRDGWFDAFLREFEATCETYPKVPVYDTEAAALAAHPLTPIDCEVTS